MPKGLYRRWEYDTESNEFKPQQNKSRNFEKMFMSYFQRQRADCKIESFYTTGTQKKIHCFKSDGFCAHCNAVFEAMGCFYNYCPCQETRPSPTEEDIERGNKKREMDQMGKQYIKEKRYNVVEMCECEWWNLCNSTTCVNEHLGESCPHKRPIREERLLEQMRSGILLGCVQCDIEVTEELGARREGDENPNSSVVAETMKLLPNSSYGYQIMDRSRHTVTNFLNDEKTHGAINTKLFKRLDHINDQLYEVELAKAEIEHREPTIVGFSYSNTLNLECWSFTTTFLRDSVTSTNLRSYSLYLVLSEKYLYGCIREKSIVEWELRRTEDCTDDFTANATTNFFPTTWCTKLKKHDKREPGFFKEEFRCTEMMCLRSKTYCCYDSNSNKYKFSSKGLKKRELEDCGDGPMAKNRKVLDEFINVTSTKTGFQTVHHSVATYEQTKKGLSQFYPKRIVDVDGNHTRPLNL